MNITAEQKIVHGDCLHKLKEINDGSIDLIMCDLPYGCTQNEWDQGVDLDKLLPELLRVAKLNAAFVFFGQGMFTANLMTVWQKYWRYNLIWAKNKVRGHLNAKRMPLRAHEDIMVF